MKLGLLQCVNLSKGILQLVFFSSKGHVTFAAPHEFYFVRLKAKNSSLDY